MGTMERVGSPEGGGEALAHGVRVGLIAYGVTHLVIAATALPLAWGDNSEGRADQTGALTQMAEQPFGDVLLWIIVIGMASLVLWQLVEAALGHKDEEGAKRWAKRSASAGKAVVYAVLGWTAVSTATGPGSSGGSGSTDGMTARLMSAPGGTWLVGAVGLGIVVVGLVLGYRGWTERFTKQLEPQATTGASRTPVVVAGKVGHLAKGAALAVVGALFLTAAVQHQPKETGGLDVALHELLAQPFGPVLLAVVAVGLGCFGIYCFFWARYLRD
jgi:hypothetical protein